MTDQRGLGSSLIVLIIVIILVVAGGAYYLGTKNNTSAPSQNSVSATSSPVVSSTPTSSPTANQSTNMTKYSGKDYTFEYPSTWVVKSGQVYNPATAVKGGNGGNGTYYSQQISFNEMSSSQTIAQYVSGIKNGDSKFPLASGDHPFQQRNLQIDNQSAIVYYDPIGEGTAGWYVIFSNGKNIFQFGPTASDPTTDTTLNSIVSSFKFSN